MRDSPVDSNQASARRPSRGAGGCGWLRGRRRGVERYDVVIVGGSFAGLAVASQLAGNVLIVDHKPIGSGQRSACATPLRVLQALGLDESVLQTHDRALLHVGPHVVGLALPQPYCTFDYEAFCRRLFARSEAHFLQARVHGVRVDDCGGLTVASSAGDIPTEHIVDASGWQAAASSLDSRPESRTRLSFGLETEVRHRDEGLHFWLDRSLHAGKVAWVFPCGGYSRVGFASYAGKGVKGQQLAGFARRFGTGARSFHGGYFPWKLRRPVAGRLLVVGDAAGQCLPLTGEGIRPAIYFGQQCGSLLQLVLEGKMTLSQAQTCYQRLVASFRVHYGWLLFQQRWGTRLPAGALASLLTLLKAAGASDRFLRLYCALMPVAPLNVDRRLLTSTAHTAGRR